MTILANDELQQLLLAAFADEAREQLQTISECLVAIEKAGGDQKGRLLEELFREAHSLKGAARAVGLRRVEALAHELESVLGAMRDADVEVLEQAYRAVDTLTALVEEGLAGVAPQSTIPDPQSLSAIFDAFPRMVRDLARELSKEVELTIEGGEIDVDKHVIEQLRSPLTHMVRNCIDHGIEDPETREAASKRRKGTVALSAYKAAADLVIEVADDGAGIDIERVKAKAVENGLITAASARGMCEREALWLIFRSELSTKLQVTELSGRGVGMNVVREHVERLHGAIDVESALGVGTRFTLSLPLGSVHSDERPPR